ncbi:Uncharacterized protein Adt_15100 [Abeliophyllum distichum]|uniref:Uncharacterized protein n=1 Tax=Abeliophyllum distichum TaxID=126358 RepID=A0ABD1U2C5_9LAMI
MDGEPTRRRRRKRWDYSTTRIAVSSFWLLLIFSRICLSSSEKISKTAAGSRWFPARKAGFFDTATYHTEASSPRPSQIVSPEKNENSPDKLYEEEKRLVHTGPNPLHN